MELKNILNETEYKGYIKAHMIELIKHENWCELKALANEQLKVNESEADNQIQDYQKTGIKEIGNGRKRYRLRYICPNCNHKGNHYIPTFAEQVICHECASEMEVRSIQNEYKVKTDEYNNYYYAGVYVPKNLW